MRLSLLLILVAFSFFSYGQSITATNPFVLSNISEENGLSDDHVQCVLKDKEGFVWIGTADGLNLMDGSSIRVFKHTEKDSTSLINNNILCLAEDSSGNIWIGTGEGMSCYHRDSGVFNSMKPPASPYGATNNIYSFVIGREQSLWCCTDGGLFLYQQPSKKFTPYFISGSGSQSEYKYSNKLRHMIAGSNQQLWLATNDGIWSFDLSSHHFKKEIDSHNDHAYHPLFMRVFEDHDKKIWAGNWQYGLKKLDPLTGEVTNYLSIAGHPDMVNCINEMRQNDGKYILWLSGNLLAFDPAEKLFFHYPKPLQSPEYPGLSPYYHSADGWMWMTSDKGLYIYNPQRQYFRHLQFHSELTTQGIVFADWNHTLLVGGQGQSFLKQYDKGWTLQKDYTSLLNKGRSVAAALSFVKENDTRLWIGNTEGIVAVDLISGQKKWFNHKEGDNTSMPRNFITHLFFDSKKQLWIFPWREGIWQMDTETGRCRRLWEGFIKEPDQTKRLLISDAKEDQDGNIWMADLDEGIILFDRASGKFSKPFAREIGEQVNVSRIFFQNGFFYANTSTFIFKWDPRKRQIQRFTVPDEMNKSLYEMSPDKNGNWWLTSKNGLILFNENQRSFKRYTVNDGLISNDLNGTLFCREDGTMLIGMSEYFTAFDPLALSASTGSENKSMLTQVLVNEKQVKWDSSTALNLDHRSTNILFRWALPDYSNPLKNQYYCQLQGIDSGWRYTGNKGEIQYANLSPGNYKVLLKAASSNGTEAANIIGVDFVINPPYWKTAWFISTLAIAVMTGLLFAVRYVSQRNLKEKLLRLEKEQAVEKERNRISRDMHDDLGSGLTKIAIMSEVVKKQMNEPEKARQQLENISESSRELIDNLQDIIWVLNPKNDTLENLAAYTREYTSKFFEPFGTGIQFNYPERFPEIKLSEETRRNIFLVIKESFNNIVKHAWCNKVTVGIEIFARAIRLTISDDGKGFDNTNIRPFGNGLINMENRMRQIGGNYIIRSTSGHGTSIVMEVPL